MTRKRYANTLEKIAKEGSKAFYEGEIAANGTMTLEDLKNYKISIRKPISIDYRGYKLYSCGAPTGGSVALSILKIIEGYNMSDPDAHDLNTHRLDEAMRFSYGAHQKLGDPDFFSYMGNYEAEMLKPETALLIRDKISDNYTKNPSFYNPSGYSNPENHGTSHIVAADASGMTITLTSTINTLWGSTVMVPETVSNPFGYVPSPINYIRPGKRPLSSITPIIVEHPNGTLYMSIGAAGGSRIITATVQSIWHVLDHGMTLPEALKEPRLHDQLLPDLTTFEYMYDNDTVDSMRSRGHNVTWVGHESSVQGVRLLWNGSHLRNIMPHAGTPMPYAWFIKNLLSTEIVSRKGQHAAKLRLLLKQRGLQAAFTYIEAMISAGGEKTPKKAGLKSCSKIMDIKADARWTQIGDHPAVCMAVLTSFVGILDLPLPDWKVGYMITMQCEPSLWYSPSICPPPRETPRCSEIIDLTRMEPEPEPLVPVNSCGFRSHSMLAISKQDSFQHSDGSKSLSVNRESDSHRNDEDSTTRSSTIPGLVVDSKHLEPLGSLVNEANLARQWVWSVFTVPGKQDDVRVQVSVSGRRHDNAWLVDGQSEVKIEIDDPQRESLGADKFATVDDVMWEAFRRLTSMAKRDREAEGTTLLHSN
ncbi:hypothetical protein B7494_g8260 [Chlorociboria aeruginascens]|nr:hypothetical protein B7494_g8260 [Chlorociboria aeruginascens]